MRLEDLGIDPKTGLHDKRLTAMESKFVGILWVDHVGEDNAISADSLAIQFFTGAPQDVDEFLVRHQKTTLEEWKRDVRRLQNHLLIEHSKIPIQSKAGRGGGYYVPDSTKESDRFYHQQRKRGMTGLMKAVRGKQADLVDVVQQMSFEFEELQDKTNPLTIKRERVGANGHSPVLLPAPVEVVDAFLARMLKDPEKFADGLRKIGKKYGSVLMPKEHVMALKAKALELQRMVAEL